MGKKLTVSEEYSDFFNRLIVLCNQNRTSPTAVIKELASSTSASSAWKKGNINTSVIPKLAQKFNVSISYIVSGENEEMIQKAETKEKLDPELEKFIKQYQSLPLKEQQRVQDYIKILYEYSVEQNKPKYVRVIDIPYYPYAASAGDTAVPAEEAVDTITVVSSYDSERADFAIAVSGDSMLPDYENGDVVLVESCEELPVGEVGVFLYEGSLVIKELGDGALISHNSVYLPMKIYDGCGYRCRGRVIGKAEVVE